MTLDLIEDISALGTSTPIQRLRRVAPGPAPALYAKLDFLLPSGTAAERVVRSGIERAERDGHWKPGQTIFLPNAGEHGIAAGTLSALRGWKVKAVVPETTPEAVIQRIRLHGVEVVTTPGPERIEGARRRAGELAKQEEGYLFDPYSNPEAVEVHRRETAAEIVSVLGDKIDCLVCGVGTGATLLGVSDVFRKSNPDIKVIAVEPSASPVLSGGEPGPHRLTSIGMGAVPPHLRQRNFFGVEKVTDEDAIAMARRLAREEGLLVSPADGAVVAAACRVAGEMKATPDADIVVILGSSGAVFLKVLEEAPVPVGA